MARAFSQADAVCKGVLDRGKTVSVDSVEEELSTGTAFNLNIKD